MKATIRRIVPLKSRADDRNVCRTVKVMTYNVLAQSLVNRNLYPTNGNAVKFTFRFPAIEQELTEYDPDIVVFQEVDKGKYEKSWVPMLGKLGFAAVYASHSNKNHGLVIAFKTVDWQLKESKTIDFEKVPESAPCQQMDSQNIALFIQIQDHAGNYLWVGTNHLYWHPKGDYERARQILCLLQEIQKLKQQWTDVPVILAGDFNSTPDSPGFRLMTGNQFGNQFGSFGSEQMQMLEESAQADDFRLLLSTKPGMSTWLVDPEQQVQRLLDQFHELNFTLRSCYDPLPEFTNWTDGFKATIDYIFTVDSSETTTQSILQLPSAEDMGAAPNSLPRQGAKFSYPSDHLALMATIAILKPPTTANARWGFWSLFRYFKW